MSTRVVITTTPEYHPASHSQFDTQAQRAVAELGDSLPDLFGAEKAALHLAPDTPSWSIQVRYERFHGRGTHLPQVEVAVFFADTMLFDEQKVEAGNCVKRIILDWFADKPGLTPRDLQVECYWVLAHGFRKLGSATHDW